MTAHQSCRAWRKTGVVIALIAAACTAPSATSVPSPRDVREREAARPSARITAAIMGEPVVLTTQFSPTGIGGSIPGVDAIEELLHAGLSVIDGAGTLKPQLAEAVPSLENGLWKLFPDGRMETTWRIRPAAMWHDGSPFTSDDLAFTASVVRDRELPMLGNALYGAIERLDTPDSRTVTVTWTRPLVNADMLFTRLRAMPYPRHLLEPTYLENKPSFTEAPHWGQEYVGAGPFRLREFVRGSHLLMEANERYVLGSPAIHQIEVRFVPDANALTTTVLAGAAELTLGARFSLDQALQVQDRWTAGSVVDSTAGWLSVYPQFINPNPPIIADVRFRRALLHAVDREQLVDTLMLGRTTVAHAPFARNHPEYPALAASFVTYAFDPREASRLFGELGYGRGSDGGLVDGSGRRLVVEARATAQIESNVKALAAVADFWHAVGVTVEQVVIPNQRVADREYRHGRPGFEVLPTPTGNNPDHFSYFHSAQVPLPSNNFVGFNRSRYSDDGLDLLIDRYYATIPRGERVEVLKQAARHITEQLVEMDLYYTTGHTLVGRRLRNVSGRALQSTEVWNAHEWTVSE